MRSITPGLKQSHADPGCFVDCLAAWMTRVWVFFMQNRPQRRWASHGTGRWRRRCLSKPAPKHGSPPDRGQGSWCRLLTLTEGAKPLTPLWSWGALWTAGRAPCWSLHRIWSSLWSISVWPASCSASSSPLRWPWSYSAFSATPQ